MARGAVDVDVAVAVGVVVELELEEEVAVDGDDADDVGVVAEVVGFERDRVRWEGRIPRETNCHFLVRSLHPQSRKVLLRCTISSRRVVGRFLPLLTLDFWRVLCAGRKCIEAIVESIVCSASIEEK